MQLKSDEISKIIKDQIKNYSNKIEQKETGYVVEVGDGIAKVKGLDNCMSNELVEFSNGEVAMALNLEENLVSLVILGTDAGIREGDISVSPAEMKGWNACQWCEYAAVCGFDPAMPHCTKRVLPPLTRQELADRLANDTGESPVDAKDE